MGQSQKTKQYTAPPPFPQFRVGVLVASNRLLARIAAHIIKRWWGGKASFLLFEVGKTSERPFEAKCLSQIIVAHFHFHSDDSYENCDHKIVTFNAKTSLPLGKDLKYSTKECLSTDKGELVAVLLHMLFTIHAT